MIAPAIPARGSINPRAPSFFAAKRGGRPRVADPASERSRRPWLAEGISERTYRRRKAAGTLKVRPPQHHVAHVLAWFATLDPIARLDHRALVRRDLIAARLAARALGAAGDVLKLYASLRGLH